MGPDTLPPTNEKGNAEDLIKLAPDLDMATSFLVTLCPNGPWVLTAIKQYENNRKADITTKTFTDLEKARDFIASWNIDHNVYYNHNRTKRAVEKKPSDTDMAFADFVHGDLDPNGDETPAEAKANYRARLDSFLKPTFLIDSGNGIQPLWRLDPPLGPDHFEAVKMRSKAVMKLLGAEDTSTYDPSRVLRLPGTVNHPTPTKLKKGRVPCMSTLIECDNTRRYKLDDFPPPENTGPGSPEDGGHHASQEVEHDLDSLPVSERIRNLIQGIDHPDHHYPTRSHAVFAVLTAMVRGGCMDDEMRAVLHNHEIGDHIRAQSNPEVYLTRQIKRAREAAKDPRIEKMNQTYALVIVGDKTPILKTPQKGFSFLTISAFEQWHANRFIQQGKTRVPLAKHWLHHPQRRQYEGITFAPNREVPGQYNVWKGFAVVPKPGDCSKFLAHLKDNVCAGDPALYEWVVGWFAHIFRTPADKSGTSLVLRGDQGVGKTKVGEVIGSLLGEHFVLAPEPRYVTGRFNSHLVACLLLQADEGFWAGDHSAEGKLRDLITGQHHFIEFKGKEAIRVQNYVRLLVTGAADWIVPAGFDERRFAVLDVAPNHKQEHAYFAAIDHEMNNGGREALPHHLLNLDLSKVNLRAIPKTEALLEQKISSLTPEAGWLFDLLARGELPWGCDWPRQCPTKRLIDDYIAHASKRGARRRAIEVSIGMFLNKHVPGLERKEGFFNVWTQEHGMTMVEGYVYEFPPLSECRANFAKLLNQGFPWNERPEWQPPPKPGDDTDSPM